MLTTKKKIGIARADPTPKEKNDLETWLDQGRHATMEWMEKRKDERGNIHTYFPEAKSIISVGMNYHVGKCKVWNSNSFVIL